GKDQGKRQVFHVDLDLGETERFLMLYMVLDVEANEKDGKGWDFRNAVQLIDGVRKTPRQDSPAVVHTGKSGDKRDCAFGAGCQGSAFRIRADGIEGVALFLFASDSMGVVRQLEVEDEILANDEKTLGSDRLHANLLSRGLGGNFGGFFLSGCLVHALVVGNRGEVCLRSYGREPPGRPAIFRKGQVRAIFFWLLVVASGDDAVEGVAKRDRENSSRVGTMHDRCIECLPALAAVGGVEDARNLAASRKPDVGIGQRGG